MRATWHKHRILLNLNIRIVLIEELRSQRPSLCSPLYSPFTLSSLGWNILLSLCSPLNMIDQVLHPQHAKGKITFPRSLYFFDCTQKTKDSEPNNKKHSLSQTLFFVWSTSFSALWRVYTDIYIYIYDCVQNVSELQLLQNKTESEIFLRTLGEVRSVDWTYIIEAPAWPWPGE